MILFKYIFFKVYIFYIRVFNEKEIPHWFAASVLTVVQVSSIIVILNTILYFYKPEIISSVNIYYKYFALAVLVMNMIYINFRNRFQYIIDDCKQFPKSKQKVLGYLSILYIVILIVGLIWIGELVRNYNMFN